MYLSFSDRIFSKNAEYSAYWYKKLSVFEFFKIIGDKFVDAKFCKEI